MKFKVARALQALFALTSNSGAPAPLPYSALHQSPLPILSFLTLGTCVKRQG